MPGLEESYSRCAEVDMSVLRVQGERPSSCKIDTFSEANRLADSVKLQPQHEQVRVLWQLLRHSHTYRCKYQDCRHQDKYVLHNLSSR